MSKWTEEEDNIMRSEYSVIGAVETSKLLPNRTHQAVMKRASKLGIKVHKQKRMAKIVSRGMLVK